MLLNILELEIDSMNPTVAELINLPKNNKSKSNEQQTPPSKRTTSQLKAPKKQKIE
jgi:hypothetical protein